MQEETLEEANETLNEQLDQVVEAIQDRKCAGFVLTIISDEGYESLYGGYSPTIWPILADAALHAASRIIAEQGIEPICQSTNPDPSRKPH